MLTVAQCFSTLIASGNGKRCSELKSILSNILLSKDEDGINKLDMFKDGFEKNQTKASKLYSEIAYSIDHLYSDVDDHYFVGDLVKND